MVKILREVLQNEEGDWRFKIVEGQDELDALKKKIGQPIIRGSFILSSNDRRAIRTLGNIMKKSVEIAVLGFFGLLTPDLKPELEYIIVDTNGNEVNLESE